MPELPEVETIRRGLAALLVGKTIAGVEVRVAKLFVGEPEALVGQRIRTIGREGKLLTFFLDEGTVLTVHLKMTGQLICRSGAVTVVGGHPEAAYLATLPHKHTHIILTFTDGTELFFNDLRKFGRMQLLPVGALGQDRFVQALGPDPLAAAFTVDYLQTRVQKHAKQPLKSFLLDQGNIAGLGNIYADESLFRAAILPMRAAGSLTRGEVRNLHDAIQETIELAIQYGGSTERDYRNAVGEKGTYLAIANVYHRTGLTCNRCLTGVIERVKIGGRSTHFCATCQR